MNSLREGKAEREGINLGRWYLAAAALMIPITGAAIAKAQTGGEQDLATAAQNPPLIYVPMAANEASRR